MEEIAMKISIQIQAGVWPVQQFLFECQICKHMEFLKLLRTELRNISGLNTDSAREWCVFSVTNFGREDGNLLLS